MTSHTTTRAPALGGVPRAAVARPRTRAWRLAVAGRPTAVAASDDGGLFVSVANKGIYYYPATDVHGNGAIPGEPLAVDAPAPLRVAASVTAVP